MRVFNDQKKVRNNLQVIRKNAKMTQEELASTVDVTRQTIISIEKGKYTPSLPLAFAIARQFKLTIEEIFIYEK